MELQHTVWGCRVLCINAFFLHLTEGKVWLLLMYDCSSSAKFSSVYVLIYFPIKFLFRAILFWVKCICNRSES